MRFNDGEFKESWYHKLDVRTRRCEKHLQYTWTPLPTACSNIQASLALESLPAVVHYATGEAWAVENVWYAGSQGGTTFSAQSRVRVIYFAKADGYRTHEQASGLAAHVCAAKYGAY
ncbi:hypothetical protein BD626DRAFT_475430 [Schizophyllum amplum]|uniref:Uncharacterized protein n=1 Tax=Schizophyllum amplum TaxID=97359 RepID=A0A550CYI5_9AGAR|nr:hypothetical protein BD626DRAFT_475430 [Auriculariopsis ampla]